MHTKWEKMSQLVNRRHSALDENRRRSSKFSENISELNYFILEKSGAIELDKKQLDPRQAKQALQKHQKTEEEIKINERIFDEGKKLSPKSNFCPQHPCHQRLCLLVAVETEILIIF